jgi:hypothetical protein
MSDTSGLREFKITGDAANALSGGGRRRRSSTRKRGQMGGDNSGALMQLAPVSAATAGMPVPNAQGLQSEFQGQVGTLLKTTFGPDKIQQFGGRKQRGGDLTAGTINIASSRAPVTPGNPPPTAVVSGINPSQPAPVVGGARVVLAPPKRKTRIALKAKKLKGGSESGRNDVPPMPGGGATRKARKIHLRVKGVTSRLAKAKKARKMAMAAPLSQVKSRLESAGVIKKGSKAPDSMLRTMYADLLITKKGL